MMKNAQGSRKHAAKIIFEICKNQRAMNETLTWNNIQRTQHLKKTQ